MGKLTSAIAPIGVIGMIMGLGAEANAATAVVTADHFSLRQINWDGSSHQMGGTSRVGGYLRNPLTAYDFETLASFDLSGITGTVTSARLLFMVSGGQSFGPQIVELFEQDIAASFDPLSVSYDFFNDGPYTSPGWSNLLGSAPVDSTSPGWVAIESGALAALAQSWINDPASNAGVVLTGTFWHWGSYVEVVTVELELEVETGAWELVGEENILELSNGGSHDFALAPDGTPYIGVRHVGPQACPMCPPPLEPHVLRFNNGAWEDLDPRSLPLNGFPAITVTSDNVPVTLIGADAWEFDGASWSPLPSLPPGFAPPIAAAVAELEAGNRGNVFTAQVSNEQAFVLELDDSGWNVLGDAMELPEVHRPTFQALTVNAQGNPVVAVRHSPGGPETPISVFEYDGTSWNQIGPTIGAGRVIHTSVAITPEGRPFVGFVSFLATLSARTVLTFDGTNWVDTGPVITDGGLAGVSAVGLATGPDGTAYSTAGFFDTVDGVDRRVVGAWTGSAWLPLTQNGYKTGSDFGHLLRVANDNTPYVMYLNDAFGFTVKRFVQE